MGTRASKHHGAGRQPEPAERKGGLADQAQPGGEAEERMEGLETQLPSPSEQRDEARDEAEEHGHEPLDRGRTCEDKGLDR